MGLKLLRYHGELTGSGQLLTSSQTEIVAYFFSKEAATIYCTQACLDQMLHLHQSCALALTQVCNLVARSMTVAMFASKSMCTIGTCPVRLAVNQSLSASP